MTNSFKDLFIREGKLDRGDTSTIQNKNWNLCGGSGGGGGVCGGVSVISRQGRGERWGDYLLLC